jgi:hypothetical protein
MITDYATCLAKQMGIALSRVSVVDGKLLGCRDSHLLKLSSDDQTECALIFNQELEDLEKGVRRDRLETRIRSALMRLQKLSESSIQTDHP